MGWINHLCLMNMKRRKSRTLLTIVGVVIGVISVVSLLSIGLGVKTEVLTQIVDSDSIKMITVYGRTEGKDKSRMLTKKTIEGLKEIDYVEKASPIYEYYMNLSIDGYNYYGPVYGIPMEDLLEYNLVSDYELTGAVGGDSLERKLKSANKPALIVGDRIASVLYKAQSGTTYEKAEKKDIESFLNRAMDGTTPAGKKVKYNILAYVDSGKNEYSMYSQKIYCDIDSLVSYIKRNSEGGILLDQIVDANGKQSREFIYSSASIKVDDLEHVDYVVKKLQDMGFQTENEKEYLDSMQRLLRILEVLLAGIGMIALVVAVIGISNTMTTSVFDRINEIGILKVLGCDPDELKFLFLYEAGIIGFVGGVIGVICSYGMSFLIDKVAVKLFKLTEGTHIAIIPWWLSICAIIGSLILSVCAGYFPARYAGKLRPIDAVTSR